MRIELNREVFWQVSGFVWVVNVPFITWGRKSFSTTVLPFCNVLLICLGCHMSKLITFSQQFLRQQVLASTNDYEFSFFIVTLMITLHCSGPNVCCRVSYKCKSLSVNTTGTKTEMKLCLHHSNTQIEDVNQQHQLICWRKSKTATLMNSSFLISVIRHCAIKRNTVIDGLYTMQTIRKLCL